jgi:hypothetical protein
MKRQLILSLAIVFTLALFAPAVSYSFNPSPVVIVDNKEKKDETKATTAEQTEKKADAATSEKKACCEKAGKAGCCKGASTSEAKACTGEKKACTGDMKTSTGEKKACCSTPKTDK